MNPLSDLPESEEPMYQTAFEDDVCDECRKRKLKCSGEYTGCGRYTRQGEQEMARRVGVVAFSLLNNQPMPATSMLPRSPIGDSSAAPPIRGDSAPRTVSSHLPS